MINRLVRVFEDNNFNNVIIPLSLDVKELVYIFHKTINNDDKQICKDIINKYKDININFIGVNEDTIDNLLTEDTTIDMSTSKYLSLVLFDKASKKDLNTIYLDEEEKVIKDYKSHSVLCDTLFKLNIEDIINLGGGKILDHLHDPIKDNKTKELIYKIIKNDNDYKDFISYFALISSYSKPSEYDGLVCELSKDEVNNIKNHKLFNRFINLGLFRLENNLLYFPSQDIKRLFKSSGALLENYIFCKLKDSNMFDDVMMSVNIDFSKKNKDISVKCELDELVLKDNTLLFVSVKSNKVDASALNEIKIHNVMFGNYYSKPVMCVNSDLNINQVSMYSKAEELGVSVIDVPDIRDDDLASKFLSIIDNTYKYEKVNKYII